MRKRRKSNWIQTFCNGRKFQRQCVNVTVTTWGRIYFLTCKNVGLFISNDLILVCLSQKSVMQCNALIIFTTAAVLYGRLTNAQSALNGYNISSNACFFSLSPAQRYFCLSVSKCLSTAPGLLWKIQTVLSQLCILSQNSLIDLLLKSHIASGDLPVSMMQVGHQILLEQQQKRRKLVDFDLKPFIHLQKAWNIANIETYGLFCAAFWAFWTWQPMINKEKKISVCISQKKKGLFWHFIWDIYIYIIY